MSWPLWLIVLGLVVFDASRSTLALSGDPARLISGFYEKTAVVRHSPGACSANAMDCSCFIQKLFAERFELRLPRTTREQAAQLRSVRVAEIEEPSQLLAAKLCPGDLIYTYEGWDWESGSRHVVVYAGGGRVLHSSAHVGGVGWSSLAWSRRFKLHGVYRAVGC